MKSQGSKKPSRLKPDSTEKLLDGLFSGVQAFFIEMGISRKRLQVWQRRFEDLGGTILTSKDNLSDENEQILVLAAHEVALSEGLNLEKLGSFTKLKFVQFKWVEECLKDGKLLSYEPYFLLTPQDNHLRTTDDERLHAQPGSQLDQCITAPVIATVPDGDLIESTELVHEQGNDEAAEKCTYDTKVNAISDDETPDLNKQVSGPLLEMSQIYSDVFADEWRSLTYRKVANKLDKLPYKISSADDIKNIQGIGKSMIDKIKEILCTGQLKKLVNLKSDSQVQIMQQFASVWGIGPKHARKLYQAGHRSLHDISEDHTLSSMARVGLKYHHDIVLRIPQSEVTEAGAFVREVLEDLCPGASMIVGGSYRRGQATCGDIDLLITHTDGHSHIGLLGRLVTKLQELEFLVACPSPSTEDSTNKVDTYLGICKLPQCTHHRRIDIKIYPKKAYPFALVYFTGNDVLNRRIRYLAKTKGYKLSDQGLFLRVGDNKTMFSITYRERGSQMRGLVLQCKDMSLLAAHGLCLGDVLLVDDSPQKNITNHPFSGEWNVNTPFPCMNGVFTPFMQGTGGVFTRGKMCDMASEVSVTCETEEEIFAKLGLPYPEPHDRNW